MRARFSVAVWLLAACGFDSPTAASGDTSASTTEPATSGPGPGTGSGSSSSGGSSTTNATDAWTVKRRLTFDNASGTEDLLDFPVLVRLDTSRIEYEAVQSGGEDLRFYDAAQDRLLPYQIERFSPDGVSTVWVRVPRIAAGSTTDHIWMAYGNPLATDDQDPPAVWHEDYLGVWHLGSTLEDSTTNALDALGGGATAGPGLFAGGQVFNGASHTDLPIGISGNERGAVALWWSATTSDSTAFLFYGSDVTSGNGYGLEAETHVAFRDQGGEITVEFRLPWDGLGEMRLASLGPWLDGQWHQLVATWESGVGNRLFIDGRPAGEDTSGTAHERFRFNGVMRLGRPGEFSRHFEGSMDEIRVLQNPVGAAWVDAQYRSQTDQLIGFGSPEPF